MKQVYVEPEVQVLALSLEGCVLTPASNEGFPVDPLNPFSSPVMEPFGGLF